MDFQVHSCLLENREMLIITIEIRNIRFNILENKMKNNCLFNILFTND